MFYIDRVPVCVAWNFAHFDSSFQKKALRIEAFKGGFSLPSLSSFYNQLSHQLRRLVAKTWKFFQLSRNFLNLFLIYSWVGLKNSSLEMIKNLHLNFRNYSTSGYYVQRLQRRNFFSQIFYTVRRRKEDEGVLLMKSAAWPITGLQFRVILSSEIYSPCWIQIRWICHIDKFAKLPIDLHFGQWFHNFRNWTAIFMPTIASIFPRFAIPPSISFYILFYLNRIYVLYL